MILSGKEEQIDLPCPQGSSKAMSVMKALTVM